MLSDGHQARQHCLLIPGILDLLATISNDVRTEAVLRLCSWLGSSPNALEQSGGCHHPELLPTWGPQSKSLRGYPDPEPWAMRVVKLVASPHSWTSGWLAAALAGLGDRSLL